MNSLPPLPLIDGALFIDNSFLEALTTCPRAMEYSRLWKRISSADAPALNYGSAIHLALEYRYRVAKQAPPTHEVEEMQASIMAKHFAENPQPEDDWRNLNWAVETMRKYNQRYAHEGFSLLKYNEPQECDKCCGSGKLLNYDCIWCKGEGTTEVMVELSFAIPLFEYDLK